MVVQGAPGGLMAPAFGAAAGRRPLATMRATATATAAWPNPSSSIAPIFVSGAGAHPAAFLVGPFLLHHKRRSSSGGLRTSATKTKTTPPPAPKTAPLPAPAQPTTIPFPTPSAAAATATALLPQRLVAKPLVDARQLTAAEIEARFAGVDFAVPRTLPQALAVFWSNPSIQIIAAGLLAILGARVAAHAPLTPGEALAVPVTVAGWVVQEWAIHRHLLHGALRWPGAAIHQQHHELPFYHVSIDPPAIVLAWGAVACAAALALLPQPLAWTVLGTYWLMGLVYEWSHYIVHTRVRPATKLGRAIKEHHTRHHLQDDRFWFAFSWPPIDSILNTVPQAPVDGGGKGGAGGRESKRSVH